MYSEWQCHGIPAAVRLHTLTRTNKYNTINARLQTHRDIRHPPAAPWVPFSAPCSVQRSPLLLRPARALRRRPPRPHHPACACPGSSQCHPSHPRCSHSPAVAPRTQTPCPPWPNPVHSRRISFSASTTRRTAGTRGTRPARIGAGSSFSVRVSPAMRNATGSASAMKDGRECEYGPDSAHSRFCPRGS